jgi:lipopolysaccharide/colanic/teichoic acid biosynthesis glycosyltransferase
MILKFRTMVAGPPGSGPLVTPTGDPRVTAPGRWLRRTKLDELPQLINVLRGDMSLVGPRPEAGRYVGLYPESLRDVVLSVRPGITDEASILYRNESELLARAPDPEAHYVTELLPRKLEIHAHYAHHHSFSGDLRILARTLYALVG